jgi:DNA uptake protein ComE-like DNA-binding protein
VTLVSAQTDASKSATGKTGSTASTKKGGLVDINNPSAEELVSLQA